MIKNIVKYMVVVMIAVAVNQCVHALRSNDRAKNFFKEKVLKTSEAQDQFLSHTNPRWMPSKSVAHRQFNFHVVFPGVWRSSQPNKDALVKMKEHGLKTIINLRKDPEKIEWERGVTKELGLQYFSFPINTRYKQSPEKLSRILDVARNPDNQPVLIHCHAGKDRTGLLVALYKLKYTNAKFDDVYQEMIMYGFHEEYHPALLESLNDMLYLLP